MPELDATQLEKPYTFFLFKSITGIYEAWDQDELELALSRAVRLVVFLPTDIKKALWKKRTEILEAFSKARNVGGADLFSRMQNRSWEAREVAFQYLTPFVDEMVRLLDQKKWLERGAVSPRFQEKRKLSA